VGASRKDAAPDVSGIVHAASVQVQDHVRHLAAQGIEQARQVYGRVKGAVEDAGAPIGDSYHATAKGVKDFHHLAMDAFKANTDATLDFARSVLGSKTIADVFRIQSEHIHKQTGLFQSQVKELGDIAHRLAADSAAPLKALFKKDK
jgi:phasin